MASAPIYNGTYDLVQTNNWQSPQIANGKKIMVANEPWPDQKPPLLAD